MNPLFQHLSCCFSMQRPGNLLSPTNCVCFYRFFPQYCTGNTPVVSNCHKAQRCKQSPCSCSEMCDFLRDCIAICIYTVALLTSFFLHISSFLVSFFFNFFFYYSTVASYGNSPRDLLACLFHSSNNEEHCFSLESRNNPYVITIPSK